MPTLDGLLVEHIITISLVESTSAIITIAASAARPILARRTCSSDEKRLSGHWRQRPRTRGQQQRHALEARASARGASPTGPGDLMPAQRNASRGVSSSPDDNLRHHLRGFDFGRGLPARRRRRAMAMAVPKAAGAVQVAAEDAGAGGAADFVRRCRPGRRRRST